MNVRILSESEWAEREIALEATSPAPARFKVNALGSDGRSLEFYYCFTRYGALKVVEQLTNGVIKRTGCIAVRDEDGEAVVVRLYARFGGRPIASIEMRPVE